MTDGQTTTADETEDGRTDSESTEEDGARNLEAENRELRERVDQLETALADIQAQLDGDDDGAQPAEESDATAGLSRRGALAALAGAGVLGIGATGSASAQSNHDHYGELFTGSGSQYGLQVRNKNTSETFAFGLEGRAESERARGIAGFADNTSGQSVALFGRNQSTEGRAIRGYADATSGDTRGILGTVKSPDGYGVEATNSASSGSPVAMRVGTSASNGTGIVSDDDIQVNGTVNATGDINVSGTKHFVQAVDTPAGEKTVRYTSVEAGRARTEYTDVAEMEDGRAEVELPEHFEMVTSDEEPLSVQVTPYATEEVKPQVVEQSADRVVVEDFSEEPGEYTFAYTVKGVRDGFEDKEVVLDE